MKNERKKEGSWGNSISLRGRQALMRREISVGERKKDCKRGGGERGRIGKKSTRRGYSIA